MEPKRVGLVTVGPVPPEKKDKKERKTFRFNITLTESTDKTCPEFSFCELVKNTLENEEADALDPFAKKDREEADKLAAIARAFEDRYAEKSGKKRKRMDRVEDLVDLGDGYDLDDPFIDNTEAVIVTAVLPSMMALSLGKGPRYQMFNSRRPLYKWSVTRVLCLQYDEIVPCNMTTKHGGFYINSGALDFKFCSDSDDDFQHVKKKKKKRVLTSDSEVSELGEKKKKKKKKLLLEGEVMKKKKKLNGDPSLIKKKKKLVSSEKIKLAKIRKGMNLSEPKSNASPTVNGYAEAASGGGEQKHASSFPNDSNQPITISGEESKGSISGVVTKETTVSLVDPETGKLEPSGVPHTVNAGPESTKTVTVTCDIPATEVSAVPEVAKPKPEIPNLPETLSLKTLSHIDKIKDSAKMSEEGKTKFFTPDINDKLLQVEKETRLMKPGERNTVYTHLAAHLPCSKETLMKRAKRLVTEQQDDSLREPINKLREAVVAAMPSHLEKHQAECAAADQKRQQQQENEKVKDKGNNSNESDDENSQEKNESLAEKQKRVPAPRKKFEWTPHIRSLLCDVVRTKMEHFETTKGRAQTAEEYLRAFLDAEVKPIWPTGWVQTRMLFKESRDVHAKWTNPTIKPKKALVPGLSVSRPGSVASSPLSSQATPNAATKSQSSNQNTPISGVKNPNSTMKSEDSKSMLTKISQSAFASPDFTSKSTGVSGVKSSQKVPPGEKVSSLLDYAGSSYTAVAKSKQNHTGLAANTATTHSNANSLAVSQNLQLAHGVAKLPSPTSSYTNDFIQQFKNFAASLPQGARDQQIQPPGTVKAHAQQQQSGSSHQVKVHNVAKQQDAAKSPQVKTGSSTAHGQHKTTAQSFTHGKKINTGSGITSGLVNKQIVVQQRHPTESLLNKTPNISNKHSPGVHSERNSQKGVLNLSQGEHKSVNSSLIQTYSSSGALSNQSIAGSANQSPLNLTNQKAINFSPRKGEHSAHNSSAESDDIPLARLPGVLTNKSISKPITTSKPGAVDNKAAMRYTQGSVGISNQNIGKTVGHSNVPKVITVRTQQAYQKPGVQGQEVMSSAAKQILQGGSAASASSKSAHVVVATSSGGNVQNTRVSVSGSARNASPSSTNSQQLRTLSPGNLPGYDKKQRMHSAPVGSQNAQEKQKQMQALLNAQSAAAQKQAKSSHSVSSHSHSVKSSTGQPQGQNASQVVRSLQNHVSRSPQGQISHSSQGQPSRSPVQGPVASSSPRPLAKSPQLGSDQAWLAGEQRGFNVPSCAYNSGTSPAKTSAFPAGLGLLDLAKASSQALQHTRIKSPDIYGQAASLFNQTSAHGQRSPVASQSSVTSPLHPSPQPAGGSPNTAHAINPALLNYRYSFSNQPEQPQYRRY